MKNTFRASKEDRPYRKLQQLQDRQPVGFPPSAKGADIRLLKHIFIPQETLIATCLSHEPRPLDFWESGYTAVVDKRLLKNR